jgi:hypothetical protein
MREPRITQQLERMARLAEATYRLPPYQRESVWSIEQARLYLSRLMYGIPAGSLLLWQQGKWGDPLWVLDGQQRLTTIGATVLRGDVPNVVPALWLDLEAWQAGERICWYEEPRGPRPLTTRQLTGSSLDLMDAMGSRKAGEWSELDALTVQAWDKFRDATAHYQVIEYGTPPERVAEIFEATNTGGTPMGPDQVEALLKSAREAS